MAVASFRPTDSRGSHRAAFPWRQLLVIALCRICEPIAFMSIFPYVYQMVSSFNLSNNDRANAMYAGMLTSSFAFAEFATSILWGRLSDKVGRKPVLLSGLAGTGVSMIVFGFSSNLTTALIARALGGLLNGNIGVLNTTVGELITRKSHQDRAFSIMPGVWCIGSVFGSAIGGLLADPVHSYPGLFSDSALFKRYPFLLPNLVCTFLVGTSLTIGLLFLEETHQDKKHRVDYGLVMGDKILAVLGLSRDHRAYNSLATSEKSFDEESDSAGSSLKSSVRSSFDQEGAISLDEPAERLPSDRSLKGRRGLPKMFTSQVLVIIVSFGILAYHTISAEQLLPIMLSLPQSHSTIRLPFFFTGGFELSTKHIGTILSSQGIIQALSTFIIFPLVSKRFGSLRIYQLAAFSYPLLYICLPYLTVLPDSIRMPALFAAITWKVTAQAFSFPPLSIALTNSSPSTKVLGTLFGTFSASASLSRAIGPTLSGLLQGTGLSVGVLGLPWWSNSGIAAIGFVLSLTMTRKSDDDQDDHDAHEN